MNLPFERTVAAPCKVNLTLDIGPKRPDGFHDIDSLVVRLSPSDEITVTVRPGTRQVKLLVKDKRPGSVADVPIPRGEENLAHAAARLALETLSPNAEVDVWVRLTKRLPAQAGLGAGSSDAAAVLQVLGEAFDADETTLHALASRLGSDVAVFLNPSPRSFLATPSLASPLRGGGGASPPLVPPAPLPTAQHGRGVGGEGHNVCRLTGRGEIVERAASVPPLWGVLVRPAVGVATGPAYALLDASPRVRRASTEKLLSALSEAEFCAETLGPLLWNDFEAPVLDAYPEVGEVHAAIGEAGAIRALLCGSGSSVWGLARDREHALSLVRQLVGRFAWVKLAVTF